MGVQERWSSLEDQAGPLAVTGENPAPILHGQDTRVNNVQENQVVERILTPEQPLVTDNKLEPDRGHVNSPLGIKNAQSVKKNLNFLFETHANNRSSISPPKNSKLLTDSPMKSKIQADLPGYENLKQVQDIKINKYTHSSKRVPLIEQKDIQTNQGNILPGSKEMSKEVKVKTAAPEEKLEHFPDPTDNYNQLHEFNRVSIGYDTVTVHKGG